MTSPPPAGSGSAVERRFGTATPGGWFFWRVCLRAIVLIDGQNLYHGAKSAWAPTPPVSSSPYGYPSYDVEKLAQALVSRLPGRSIAQIRFYTGVPNPDAGPMAKFWHGFWTNKLRYLASRGIYIYKGRVNPGGQEKGDERSGSNRGIPGTEWVRIEKTAYDTCFDPRDYRMP